MCDHQCGKGCYMKLGSHYAVTVNQLTSNNITSMKSVLYFGTDNSINTVLLYRFQGHLHKVCITRKYHTQSSCNALKAKGCKAYLVSQKYFCHLFSS